LRLFARLLLLFLLARKHVGRVGPHLRAGEMCRDFAFLGVALLLRLVWMIAFAHFMERRDVEVGG
jgi:hypothetical protein